jgi:magnesium chelatase family protein
MAYKKSQHWCTNLVQGTCMRLSLVQSRALLGLQSPPVTVEVHLANGLPSFTLVGLADVEVKEARERVRSALQNSGFEFPSNQRITVNLAPADLPKDSGRFDLPIALGILAASGQIDGSLLSAYEFAGELSLSGALRPIKGALVMGLALYQQPKGRSLVLPPGSAEEAALVPDVTVYRADHLSAVAKQFANRGAEPTGAAIHDELGWAKLLPEVLPVHTDHQSLDLADVKGQSGAKRALEIAAAGGHSVLMMGPPGSGKSMLAHRFSGLLSPLNIQESLEAAAIASLAGRFDLSQWSRRPTRHPHHSASAVALVGGGSPPRPGEISLAHHGVLFLDELPEFPRAALEALREPLESGSVTISRAAMRSEFPARFQLIAAMNPCPCGYAGQIRKGGQKGPVCRCTPHQVHRYMQKISGPLLDRIDLHIEVPSQDATLLINASAGESSASVRDRCLLVQLKSAARQGCNNQTLSGAHLENHCALNVQSSTYLARVATHLGWSGRSTHRVLKVARTIADLENCKAIETKHIAEAIQYRRQPETLN